jgi:Zn finger protein HypA/HybF involved in hydrogenase expression
MALPMQQAPLYTVTIPSSKKEVKYRPFLVKEEKALLIAQQSEDSKVMIDTLKQVLVNCIQDKIDPNDLAIFDCEYLFTQIRSKSVGEDAELVFLCDDCESEDAKIKARIDITKSQVYFPKGHTTKIALFDDVGVVLKYPRLDTLEAIEKVKDGNIDALFELVISCIDYIYNTDEVFYPKDQTKQENLTWLENLTQEQFGKIQAWFEDMPRLQQDVQYKCPVCQKQHDKVLEGIDYFF